MFELSLTVTATHWLTPQVRAFELRSKSGPLTPFTAGAHLKVQTPSGLTRNYSLYNAPHDDQRYCIAVKRESREDGGGGGSIDMVDELHEGMTLRSSTPTNAFALREDAQNVLLIAGGIGITPLLSMANQLLHTQAATFRLLYLTRAPEYTAFGTSLSASALAPHLTLHHDYGDPAQAFDLWPLLEQPSNAHIYCCGPKPLMEAVRDMSGHWPNHQVHFESFGPSRQERLSNTAFEVLLEKTGKTIHVSAGETLLQCLRSNGIAVSSSCESGSCGACRTRLVAGQVDHRDYVLAPSEHTQYVMPCVSRAASTSITLDL
jgi:phthalate 4,5-dioxygenase reductase component